VHAPLYRLSFDADRLFREHPPVLRHPNKIAVLEIACPPGSRLRGSIEVTRWPAVEGALPQRSREFHATVTPGFYDYAPIGEPEPCLEWHVNFADPELFVAYGTGLFAQDEMQAAEHPALGPLVEALRAGGHAARTVERGRPTPILVRGVERRVQVLIDSDPAAGRFHELYGNRFAAAPVEVVRRAVRMLEPPTITNLIAMAAPHPGSGRYSHADIEGVLSTAVTAFTAAVEESHGARVVVHTGFWGCGAFGGDKVLMTALQSHAARVAGVDRLVFHAGGGDGPETARRGLELADTRSIEQLVEMGFEWGVSDGN
jgi:hypothetical protein